MSSEIDPIPVFPSDGALPKTDVRWDWVAFLLAPFVFLAFIFSFGAMS